MIIVEPTNNERGPIYKFVYTFFGIVRKHRRVAGHRLIFTNNLEWLLIFKNISGVIPKSSGDEAKIIGDEAKIIGDEEVKISRAAPKIRGAAPKISVIASPI